MTNTQFGTLNLLSAVATILCCYLFLAIEIIREK